MEYFLKIMLLFYFLNNNNKCKGEKMSVVVAVKSSNSVWMACDSQLTYGGLKTNLIGNKNNYKIFRSKQNKHLLIGMVGNWTDHSILKSIYDIIPTDEVDEVDEIGFKDKINIKKELSNTIMLEKNIYKFDYDFVVNHIRPRIFSILDENDRLIYCDGAKNMQSELLIAYKNQLFQIGCGGAVTEIDEYIAIGAGSHFAYGSLYATRYIDMLIEEKCCSAVKAACEHSVNVNYPLVLTNTMWRRNKFNIV